MNHSPKPGQKLRIIVAGLVGQFPLGGVAWDYFHYLLGLAELGHDVYYHEDTWCWPFDPINRCPATGFETSVNFIRDFFNEFAPHLAKKWHYVVLHEQHFGMTESEFTEIEKTADIFLNVSGASFFPANLSPNCVKVFMDTDPGYNQIMLSEKFAWSENVERWCKMVADHDRHLTYAENIHGSDCVIPKLDFDWRTTRCVVSLPSWARIRAQAPPPNAPITTVMTWDWFRGKLIYRGVEYANKATEFEKFHDLPHRLPREIDLNLALAVGGVKTPHEELRRDGWQLLDAHASTLKPGSYQKLIADSAAEWSVAKNVYVATRSGWFSCRTACYLAAGRPAVVQDTGWSKFVPSGRGVIAFSTMEQAVAGLKEISANSAAHRDSAYEIAREYLAPDRVLPQMIDAIYDAR
jgi:hypothetical protein